MIEQYLKLVIGDLKVEVTNPDDIPIAIDYELEDPQNFQVKNSNQALGITIPATLINQKTGNNFSSPDAKDLTAGEVFRGNQPFTADAGGYELLNGKAFLDEASHNDRPKDYKYDLYGSHAGWVIDLQESTLYDFLKHINFIITKQLMIDSWVYDGTNEALPYVFAPVKYRQPVGGYRVINNKSTPVNDNFDKRYLRPAISKYFILYWAFKSLGYRIESNFFNTPFFRRQVMPWTWGSFLASEGTRLDVHRFLAHSVADVYFNGSSGNSFNDFVNLNVLDTLPGTYDNNGTPGDYTYDMPNKEMVWTYNQQDFGALEVTLSMKLFYSYRVGGNNSDIAVRVEWYKTTAATGIKTLVQNSIIVRASGPTINLATATGSDIKEIFLVNQPVAIGDKISAKVFLRIFRSKQASNEANVTLNVQQFQIDAFSIPLGGTIDLQNYTGLKKYKWMDYLTGVIDEYNLSIHTDTINKKVIIEPTHNYSLTNNLAASINPGYFKDDFISWDGKEDLLPDWKMKNFKDYEREVTFRYLNDGNDGGLKVVQDRNINVVAAGKYVFPGRFKTGKKEVTNRFFAPTMHYDATDFKAITGIAPQMICIIPENVSNTSSSEADNTFTPKSCYYKGLVTGAGGWKFDGEVKTDYPFMFAVNYKAGGENDPILSYSDELIGDYPPLNLTGLTFSMSGSVMTFNNQNNILTNFYAGQSISLLNTVNNNGTYTIFFITIVSPTQFTLTVSPALTTETTTTGRITSPGNTVIGKGLLKRFYWQRLAIMRNGQYYNTWFRLKNRDVANKPHREFISYQGHLWQLIQIKNYSPLSDKSTACLLYRWAPVEQADADATYPSSTAVMGGIAPGSASFDVKYSRLKCLYTDVPNT